MAWSTVSRHKRGYGSAWYKLRKVILRRDRHLCQPCLAQYRVTPATQVDHIKAKANGGTDDPDNLQSICDACHKRKTIEDQHGERLTFGADGWPTGEAEPPRKWGYSIPRGVQPSAIPVVLVCGPPGAGKTTYVQSVAMSGDVVIDLDAYKVRVGGKPWDTDPLVFRRAVGVRDADIRALRHATGGTCYLIVSAPTKAERREWCVALKKVTVKVIDTDAEECIRRILSDSERLSAASGQVRAVREWWRHNRR